MSPSKRVLSEAWNWLSRSKRHSTLLTKIRPLSPSLSTQACKHHRALRCPMERKTSAEVADSFHHSDNAHAQLPSNSSFCGVEADAIVRDHEVEATPRSN